jgi:hypothetical protein
MSKNKTENSDDVVGYKKPPRHTQFVPGKSGNPRGRPKKTKSISDVFTKHLNKKVAINIGGDVQKTSMLDAIAMKHINKAATGDTKSAEFVFRVLKPHESDRDNNIPDLLSQFRAIHASRVASDQKLDWSSSDDKSEEAGDDDAD